MPKFEKGSPEAIEHMRILRERRKNKPLTELQISRNNKKLEVQGILNEALDKYYMAGSAVVEVPEKIVNVDNKGNAKIIDTLTKTGNLKKVKGESVIKLETGNDLIVKTKGKRFKDSSIVINTPEKIIHKSSKIINNHKPNKLNLIPDDDKIVNDIFEVEEIIKPKNMKLKKTPDINSILNEVKNLKPIKLKTESPKPELKIYDNNDSDSDCDNDKRYLSE
jgi:hypothetical protein